MTFQGMENSLRNVYKIRQKTSQETGLGSDVKSTVLRVDNMDHNSHYWSVKWQYIHMTESHMKSGRKSRKSS